MNISPSMPSIVPKLLLRSVICHPLRRQPAANRYAWSELLRKGLQLVLLLFFLSVLSACYPGTVKQRWQQHNNPAQFSLYFSQEMLPEDCRLIERYYSEEIERREYPGILNMDEFSCTVLLPIEQFKREFKFCYLAGISQDKADGSRTVECFIQKRNEDYQFKAAINFPSRMSSLLACNFSCISLNRSLSD